MIMGLSKKIKRENDNICRNNSQKQNRGTKRLKTTYIHFWASK